MYTYLGYNYWPFSTILWILFWVLIVGFVFRLIRGPRWHGMYHRDHGWWKDKDAMDILKERYAKGEINKQEFEEKKADILK
ncbi:MAG: SHOCT domain-containing protein [Minisyncoccia bacterium]